VLAKVDILPRMSESLDALNGKMDRIEGIIAKKTAQEQIALRKEDPVNPCEIPASSVTKGAFISEGGQSKVCAATYAGRPAALKEISLKFTLKEVGTTVHNRGPYDQQVFPSEHSPNLWRHDHRHGLSQNCHGICTQRHPP